MPFTNHNLTSTAVAAFAAATATILFYRRQRFSYSSSSLGNSFIVLFVKSSEEGQIARSIKANKETLKFSDEGDTQGVIRVLLQSEVDSIDALTFRDESYMCALNTKSFGRLVIWSPCLPSTNNVVSKNFFMLPVGTVCITDVRYKGRGRTKNAAFQEMAGVSQQLEREDVLAAFFNNFEKLFEAFLHQGFQVLEELYYKTWLHSDEKVIIEEKQGEQVVKIMVTIKGITLSGYLLAMDEEQRYYELHPDGNSFDFFKGLVRRNLD